jgi:hypothetical protein
VDTISQMTIEGTKVKLIVMGGRNLDAVLFCQEFDLLVTSIYVFNDNTLLLTDKDDDTVIYKCIVDDTYKVIITSTKHPFSSGKLGLVNYLPVRRNQQINFQGGLDSSGATDISELSIVRIPTDSTIFDNF